MAKHSLSSTAEEPPPNATILCIAQHHTSGVVQVRFSGAWSEFRNFPHEQARCSTDQPCARAAGEGGEARRLDDPHGPTASDLGIAPKDVHQGRMLCEAEKAEPGLVPRTVSVILQSLH